MLVPSFKKGLILKDYMLDALRDYPQGIVELIWKDYSDGIISGFEISTENGNFQINPGLLKYDGKTYFSNDKVEIIQEDGSHFVYAGIDMSSKIDGIDLNIRIIQSDKIENDKIELFRYVKNGVIYPVKNLNELFEMPHNRIDCRYAKHSMINGYSLCYDYLKLYAKEVLLLEKSSIKDIAFAYQCLNGIENAELVYSYFGKVVDNEEIIKMMKANIERLSKKDCVEVIKKQESVKENKTIVYCD